jgi:hypothetical protein
MTRTWTLMLALVVASAGCVADDRPGTAPDDVEAGAGDRAGPHVDREWGAEAGAGGAVETAERADSVEVFFSRGETVTGVMRAVPPGGRALESALHHLLRGPTEAERAAGLHSWFSSETAGALRSVAVDEEGHATVDFADLRTLIPNASASAGSAMLLRELNATVFGIAAVRSVEYRMEGSCDGFGEWLQYGCVVVERP